MNLHSPKDSLPRYGLIAISLLGLITLSALTPFDQEWTLQLIEQRWKVFAEIMRRNVFEDGNLGGSDPIVFLLLGSLIGYIYSSRTTASLRWQAYRPFFAYLSTSSLFAALGGIHGLKWVMGRARPHGVMKQGLDYSEWYEFGPHFVGADGIFYSSFPSGHTAAAFLLMALTYVLHTILASSWKRYVIVGLWGVLSLGYGLIMMVARVMAKAHWLSDGLGAIILTWICLHVFYFWIFKVPQQWQYYQEHQKPLPLPAYYELKLVGWLLLCLFSLVSVLISLRAWAYDQGLLMLPLAFLGLVMGYFSWRAFNKQRTLFF